MSDLTIQPITIDEIKAALSSYGLTVPDMLLNCYIEIVNEIIPCLDENNVSECKAKIILINSAILLADAAGTVKISSTSGASGSSVSFKYDDEFYDKLKNQIEQFDEFGCALGLIPEEPGAKGFFDVVGYC